MVAMASERKRAAIYCRVSTTKQVEGASLETQERFCREYAERQGYEVEPGLVVREVYTGEELWDRPKLGMLRDEIRRRNVGVLVAYATDRLSRDPVHLLIVLEEADHAGSGVEFVTEPVDNTPEGQLVQFVRGYSAKMEHAKIRERTMRGKRARVEHGKIHGSGTELYGYRRDKERGIRLIHEEEAAIVRRIFGEVVEGKPMRTIAADLNREGVPSPAAGKREFTAEGGKSPRWGTTALQRMLTNPEYKGEPFVWRYQSAKTKSGPRGIDRDPSQWLKMPEGVTPAIVEPATWEAARVRRENNHGQTTRNASRPYLLRGFAYCAICGVRLSPQREKGTYPVYRCGSRDMARGSCGGKRVLGEKLEAWAWEHVERVLIDPGIVAAEVERQRQEGPDRSLVADLEATERVAEKLTKQQERLVRRLAETDDGFPVDIIEREMVRIEGERKAATARAAELRGMIGEQEAQLARLDSLEEYCERVRGNVDALDFAGKRDAVEWLVERVVADGTDPTNWRVEIGIPMEPAGVSSLTC